CPTSSSSWLSSSSPSSCGADPRRCRSSVKRSAEGPRNPGRARGRPRGKSRPGRPPRRTTPTRRPESAMTQPVDGADTTPDEETPEADAAADEPVASETGRPTRPVLVELASALLIVGGITAVVGWLGALVLGV